jgi:hypothetical protein
VPQVVGGSAAVVAVSAGGGSIEASALLAVASSEAGGGGEGRKKIPNRDLKAPPAKRGNAPTGADDKPIELHHRNQTPDGPLDETTATDHRGGGNFKKKHPNTGQEPSKIDRKAWRKEQKDYWKNEWDSGRFGDVDG